MSYPDIVRGDFFFGGGEGTLLTPVDFAVVLAFHGRVKRIELR